MILQFFQIITIIVDPIYIIKETTMVTMTTTSTTATATTTTTTKNESPKPSPAERLGQKRSDARSTGRVNSTPHHRVLLAVMNGHKKIKLAHTYQPSTSSNVPSMVKFQRDTAMEMTDVITPRMLELGIVTPSQVALPGFSVGLAKKSDLSASTRKELQEQVLHFCHYGLLARWVLQNNGSRVLEIVRCSGIEGHHPDSKSSWANEESNPRVRNHALYNKGKFFFLYMSSKCIPIVLFINDILSF